MDMNEATFFAYLRRAPFGGRMTQSQIDGVKRIHNACMRGGVQKIEQRAYVLASVFHETGARMQPVREAFASSDAKAKAALEQAWQAGRLPSVKTPYWRDGWFGRGDIQITHEENYRKLGKAIGVDLVANPALALDPDISARIAVVGMRDGLFAKGQTLARYFPNAQGSPVDPLAARKIVNGSDKRHLIAGHYEAFLGALQAAVLADAGKATEPALPPEPDMAKAPPPDVPAGSATGDDTSAARSPANWLTSLPIIGAFLASVTQAVTNPWALGATALIVIGAGAAFWAYRTGRISFNKAEPL
jgi:putative chitinase